ncbi:hypothetical protein ACJMK2_020167 [Sinanodonta woodiana]|uniref:procollagen-proline 3-dioxygenase n=1 Tax=Sinanodonta woodiana TaxID=1069815 RepID=A0ABD3TZA0_SINWO
MACIFEYTTIFILFIVCFTLVKCQRDGPEFTYDILYERGVKAYEDGSWYACASHFYRSIQDYQFYMEDVTHCRLTCKKGVISAEAVDIDFELNYYWKIVKISDCLQRCNREKLGKRAETPASHLVNEKFEDRVPYDYLQFCLFKLEMYKEAAASAYTYFITHQDHQRIIDSMKYYRGLEGVTDEDFKDLERNDIQDTYASGLNAYHASDWTSAIENFEESLRLYFEEEEKCRAACEGPYSHKGHPDFTNAVADHFLVVLFCQYKCEEKLSVFGKEFQPNFVSEHYNYLQYSYFKVNDMDKAVRAVATFILFQPNNETMLKNKAYYKRNSGVHQRHFIPFEEAKQYYERRKIVSDIIDYVKTKHALSPDKLVDETSNAWRGTKPSLKEINNPHSIYQPFMEYSKDFGVTIFAESAELGSSRLAADGFLHDDHCRIISDFIRKRKPGSTGVRQITIPEIMQDIAKENENVISLRLLTERIESFQQYISAYYNSAVLFVKQAKIVCREGDGEWEKKQHEDCIPQEDGSCIKTFSHLSDQEYIGVVYLTNVTDGTGELYFMDKDKQIKSSLAPKCGRLVIFKASQQHGVNPSSVNERCSLYVHLTSNVNDEDKSQRQVKEFLNKMDEGRAKQPSEVNNTEILQQFYDQGNIKILRSIGCITFMVKEKMISMNDVLLALDISEMSRHLVEKFLNLSHPLYFDFTHLVCRTAKEEAAENRSNDLSHPVHADNCVLQPDGTCIMELHLYPQRRYSAILYLNEDIEGGDFFFAYPNKTVQVSVKPKCGRLVAFNAGDFHGVKAVLKGQRCALAMWYTMDSSYNEISRKYARRVFSKMEAEGKKRTIREKNNVQNAVKNKVQNKNAGIQKSQSSSKSASKESKDVGAEHTDNESDVSTGNKINSLMEVKSTDKEEL